ncbi:hypothetical protein HNY73_012012 [Argiope bruennichi]|uniref:Uncharacterized protein n=1 Tax=Argiope bruennichi TaxID=94029 RepID=A0A8T0EV66_ARGBR|nr:hypothetical protein HNY73_012012 [Argiope bruennichi]
MMTAKGLKARIFRTLWPTKLKRRGKKMALFQTRWIFNHLTPSGMSARRRVTIGNEFPVKDVVEFDASLSHFEREFRHLLSRNP